MKPPIKLLIVDDSAVVRKVLSAALAKVPGIEVVATAMDPFVARRKIFECQPDVLLLDVEMPRMDGLTFLEQLMAHHPLPVVILSSLAPEGSATYLRALSLGAMEVIQKPGSAVGGGVRDQVELIAQKITAAAGSNLKAHCRLSAAITPKGFTGTQGNRAMAQTTQKIVAVGASTGGTQTFRALLAELPADAPPIVLVQHMPPFFTSAYAKSLNEISAMEVREAMEGDVLRQGQVLVAPGNFHIELRRSGARYYVTLHQAPPVFHVRPSVDVLFHSVASAAGNNAVGVLLTGMGSDGARGLLALRQAGGRTLLQDEASCVVYGMPKAAYELGACDEHTPLGALPEAILDATRETP